MKNIIAIFATSLPFSAHAFPGMGAARARGGRDALGDYYKRHYTGEGPWPQSLARRGAVPISAEFPYAGSVNGLPATRPGGFVVPDPDDPDHQFIAPGPGDIRGPCPGNNMAANYGFISRDGRTTANELVSAAQNFWNLEWSGAVFLTVIEFAQNGDLAKPDGGYITIGRPDPDYADGEGFNGHGMFEQDVSMSRQDLGISGDASSFSPDAYLLMDQTCREFAGGMFNFTCFKEQRLRKYEDGIANNPNFTFGPLEFLLYGATVFVYGLFPSGGTTGIPEPGIIDQVFGASPNADRSAFTGVPESVPAGWKNRVLPFSTVEAVTGAVATYLAHPVLFGGNTGKVNSFDALNNTFFDNGQLKDTSVEGVICLIANTIVQNDAGLTHGAGILGTPLNALQLTYFIEQMTALLPSIAPSCVLSGIL